MLWRLHVILFVGSLLEWQLTQCAPAEVAKSKEKVRAYEFGFSIEENQHRHEKRDENGIVMGEFGFITADGIYHVTVYATDENGKFKILAMKNYPYADPEKKIMIAMLPLPKKPVVVPALRKATPFDTASCGSCVLTNKFAKGAAADVAEKIPEDPDAVFRPLSKPFNDIATSKKNVPLPGGPSPKGISSTSPPSIPFSPSLGSQAPQALRPSLPSQASAPKLPPVPSLPLKPNAIGLTASKATPQSATNGNEYLSNSFAATGQPTATLGQLPVNRQNKAFAQNGPQQLESRFGPKSQFVGSPQSIGGAFNPTSQTPSFGNAPALPANNRNLPQQPLQNTLTPNTASVTSQNAKETKLFQSLNRVLPSGDSPTFGTVSPQVTSINALTQSQPTDTYTRTGVQQGNTNGARTTTPNLPSTKSQTPSSQAIGKATQSNNGGGALYRFNYVLDYNSHREEGRLDGSKEGSYKTIDEDGVRRIIDYIANENGFQPHIKWERVPANELPTGENKLQEYEFVWFN